ncbi:ABC transporter ATP-binding protein [Allobaculum mucilyticum]|uniref:ABC transporter ATP-binding protein n=1 Tax=Allobaculum mucilyticum TaxID=2834459 RepID=UPI001E322E10|nr:ATP-binding cassette domain-containing protein [Allobaculum mucilyticum]UNT95935.1 ATP-binding cassette domain-containing protein [Allobaculum mucilyticum]
MLELNDVSVIFNEGTVLEKKALDHVSIRIEPGQFVTILGSNGAGKSTFFNVITGFAKAKTGSVVLDGVDITEMPEHVRSRSIGRLFQDPKQGTAPHLSVEENMGLACSSGRGPFAIAVRKKEEEEFRKMLERLDMGLETRLKTPIGLLSGGQRQAVALLMAVTNTPKILLLDEHTAALDPISAKKILQVTNEVIEQNNITALMITHNLRDALENGNRLLIFQDGKITHDFNKEQKEKLTLEDLIHCYDV